MNIGIFGGSFDPPHLGHLILAEHARTGLGLDTILFVPAFLSPFKAENHITPAMQRCEMVGLAIADNPAFRLECIEALHEQVSYSVDTIRHLHELHPGDHLYLIVGADAFNDFDDWREPGEIISMATLAVGCRSGVELDLAHHPYGHAAVQFTMPDIQISSTDIRRRCAAGLSIHYLVPWAVGVFIESHGLYRSHMDSAR